MAPMQGVNALIFRGRSGFKLGKDATPSSFELYFSKAFELCTRLCKDRRLCLHRSEHHCKVPLPSVSMEENPFTLQAILYWKQIAAHGRLHFDTLNQNSSKDAGQNSAGTSKHPSASNHGKADFLGRGLSAPTDGTGFSNLTVEFQTYLKEMEPQIRTLRNENYELKQSFTHLFTLAHTTNTEVRSLSLKIIGQIATIFKMDFTMFYQY